MFIFHALRYIFNIIVKNTNTKQERKIIKINKNGTED